MGFLDGLTAGGGVGLGGASGPAYSGGSPVFQIARDDPGSFLYDDFLGGAVGGGNGGASTAVVVGVSLVALAIGVGLTAYFKKG